jgi:predicted O-methyltransferase YrrM
LNSKIRRKAWQSCRFIDFLLHSGNRYRVHSPFLFILTNEVLRNKGRRPDTARLEQIRKDCLKSKEIIRKTDYGEGGITKPARVYPVAIRQIARNSLTPPRNAERLLRLAGFMKAGNILEIGTSLGITTAYLALGSPGSRIITLEGCPELSRKAREHFVRLGINNIELREGRFEENLPAALSNLGKVDLVYIDGNHHKEAMLDYFGQCLAYSGNDTIIIFDDIHSSPEMEEAWDIVRQNEEVRVSLDLFTTGWLMFRKESSKQHFRLRYI